MKCWRKGQNCEIKSCSYLFIFYCMVKTSLHTNVHNWYSDKKTNKLKSKYLNGKKYHM